LGLTQEELANRMGYKSKSTINKIELGINDIPQSKIKQFAEVFDTTPAHLMGWDVDEKKTLIEPQLSEGEKALLELFRLVPKDRQELVLQMIRIALKTKE
jgi:transcriptional regulator with XRE-family HTH domain